MDPQIERAKDAIARLNAEAAVAERRSVELSEKAEQAMLEANEALNLSRTQAEAVRLTIDQLNDKAKEIGDRIARANTESIQTTEVMKDRMDVLTARLSEVSLSSAMTDTSGKTAEDYALLRIEARNLETLREQIEGLEKQLSEGTDERENGRR